ncbi:MAG TPA: cell division protein FtsQ/DivIB, partial [Pseudomonadales bacterium]|nr:cell division protein FtsQ/DivIB [Pseudomonadales bacterium]
RLEGSVDQRDKITLFYYETSQLLQDQNVGLASLKMNTAFDWQIELNNGLLLVMSSQQGIEKLKQFKAIYAKHIVPQLDKISRVDLRYDTGFVVAWRDDKNSLTGGSLALR